MTDTEDEQETPGQIRDRMAAAMRDKRKEPSNTSRDESSLVASMVAKRLGLPDGYKPRGISECPLINLSLESFGELEGSILVYRRVPAKAADIELGVMVGTGGVDLEEAHAKTGRSRSPAKILEDEFTEAKNTAGAWVSRHRVDDTAMVFRSSKGVLMVYYRYGSRKTMSIDTLSIHPMISMWVWEDRRPSRRVLSTLDAFTLQE